MSLDRQATLVSCPFLRVPTRRGEMLTSPESFSTLTPIPPHHHLVVTARSNQSRIANCPFCPFISTGWPGLKSHWKLQDHHEPFRYWILDYDPSKIVFQCVCRSEPFHTYESLRGHAGRCPQAKHPSNSGLMMTWCPDEGSPPPLLQADQSYTALVAPPTTSSPTGAPQSQSLLRTIQLTTLERTQRALAIPPAPRAARADGTVLYIYHGPPIPGQDRFNCPFCPKAYSRWDSLRRHNVEKHKSDWEHYVEPISADCLPAARLVCPCEPSRLWATIPCIRGHTGVCPLNIMYTGPVCVWKVPEEEEGQAPPTIRNLPRRLSLPALPRRRGRPPRNAPQAAIPYHFPLQLEAQPYIDPPPPVQESPTPEPMVDVPPLPSNLPTPPPATTPVRSGPKRSSVAGLLSHVYSPLTPARPAMVLEDPVLPTRLAVPPVEHSDFSPSRRCSILAPANGAAPVCSVENIPPSTSNRLPAEPPGPKFRSMKHLSSIGD